jgi:hypothetical protein
MGERTCTLCGKPITVWDNTISYYDENGNTVIFHAACKAQQREAEDGEDA